MTDPIDDDLRDIMGDIAAAMGEQRRLCKLEDYVFDKAQEQYWDIQDNTLHGEKAVDGSIARADWPIINDGLGEQPQGRGRRRGPALMRPSVWLQQAENDRFVESSTWWPGMPKVINDHLITEAGAFPAPGRRSFNQYREPPRLGGRAENATPWIEHVKKLWPEPKEHEFFFDYCAHMVQRPEEKCNAAIVLSGGQGIGKDAALDPVKNAVGSWNHKGIDPDQLFSPYRPWLQTLMLVVDEVRPSKDEFHASSMYNILKPMIVAPPNTLPLNDKYVKLRYVINVMRVFITTNDWMAMYIPPEDRRMFIMHSTLQQKWHEAAGNPEYFMSYWAWLDAGGREDVAAWLRRRDLSAFNPKRQVEKTAGWEAVAGSWATPEDCITQALETLGKPEVLFGQELSDAAFDEREEMAGMMKSPRKIAHRMQREGYLLVKCPDGDRWIFRHEGKVWRSRLAFVKQQLMSDEAAARAAIRERGLRMAVEAKDRGLKVVNSGSK